MMQVYTPQAWLSVFGGSPSLVIDDKGYIYSADGYYKIFSDSPIGKIDFEKGFIYDKHYLDLFATPIAQMERKGDVLEIREYGKSSLATFYTSKITRSIPLRNISVFLAVVPAVI